MATETPYTEDTFIAANVLVKALIGTSTMPAALEKIPVIIEQFRHHIPLDEMLYKSVIRQAYGEIAKQSQGTDASTQTKREFDQWWNKITRFSKQEKAFSRYV